MNEIKNILNGLDLDTSLHLIPRDKYIDALNVTLDAVAGSQDRVITNVVGNRKISYSYPSGRGKYIGAYENTIRNTVIGFRWNENNYHGIYEVNLTSRTITKIFESITDSGGVDILNFTENNKIYNVNVYNRVEGDLLFFLDSQGRPSGLDIKLFKAGTYTPVTRDILDKCKLPPLTPPRCSFGNDSLTNSNNHRNELSRYKQRWVYDDFEKSCWSPISKVALPANILDETFTNVISNNNVVFLTLDSGGKNVKAIEIAWSYVNKSNDWSPFELIKSINKKDGSIANDTTLPYSFYAESTYAAIDPTESDLLFDRVPDEAGAQELPNGDTLVYADITEGYNRDLIPNVVTTVLTKPISISDLGTLSVTLSFDGISSGNKEVNWQFFGIPAVGTKVQLKVQRASDGMPLIVSTYTTIGGDTADSVSIGVMNNTNVPFVSPFIECHHPRAGLLQTILSRTYYEANASNGYYTEIIITPPLSSAASNSIASWPWSESGQIALVYFDRKGKTNSVLYNAKVVFPAVAESGGNVLIPYINIKIYNLPPIWAWSYQIVFVKDPITYIYWQTINVVTSDSENIYFDVSNFILNATKNPTTAQVCSYSFQDADRMMLIKNMDIGTVYPDTFDAAVLGQVVDPLIGGVTNKGTFIKIKNVQPFSSILSDLGANKNFVIKLYRPAQSIAIADAVFFECGEQYPILNPNTANRLHGGGVTNQDFINNIPAETNIYDGYSYFRTRTIPLTDTTSSARFYIMDKNFVDFYISAVNSISGRPNLIDLDQRQATYGTLIRFGQSYQPSTNINGLGRFYENDSDIYDASYGRVVRIFRAARFLDILQMLRVGTVPLFSTIVKDPKGANVQITTDRLLNPIQYDVYPAGIGNNAESLCGNKYARYFTSDITGGIYRKSNDGVQPLSILYKVNSWANDNLPPRNGNSKVYGTFDPKANNYIIALEQSVDQNAITINNQSTFAYSGQYGRGNDINTACGTSSQVTIYTGAPFGLGVILYIDAGLTTPLIDYNYVTTSDGHVYSVDSLTGQVLENTGGVCRTGTASNYIIGNNSSIICNGTVQVLYTNGAFAIGSILYYDSALVIPVTGFAFVVNVATQIIYNVNISTGQVLSVTGSSCTTYPIGNMEIDNRSSVDMVLQDVQVNGNSVTITSGSGSFPINQGQEVSATTNQIGTYDITITVGSSGMGRSINVTGSDGISQCQNVSFAGFYIFSGIVVNSVNPVFISTSGGTC